MNKSIEKTIESEKKATSESLEVSYLLIDNVQKEPVSTLQKIATTINVQLTLPDGEEIPFIPFNEYNHALNEDKIYLYGSSGVGKSRIIYEIVKNKISNFERVFIINPRNTLHEYNSGRIDIYDLVDEFKENDIVLWDNFPDNLVKKDYDSSLEVLEKISSRGVKNLLIALKPKYLESYRNIAKDIIELYKHYIKYDKEKIRNITKLYGTNTRYKQIYNKHVARGVDKISKILWEKEPTPLTVLDYYKALSNRLSQLQDANKESSHSTVIDAITEAENLPRSMEYRPA